jgi:hypothetical protein
MAGISRRRFLALPLSAFTAGPSRPSLTRLEQYERRLKQMQQGWPDRANPEPEAQTLEELIAQVHKHALKIRANDGVDQIHSQMIAEGYRWIKWLVYVVGGQIMPPARGDV